MLDRTEGENGSTGKTKLQRKKSKQRGVWKQALRGRDRECCAQGRGQDRGCGQGAEQTPPWHLGMEQQGIVSLWPLEHGAVGTSQQVQAGQGGWHQHSVVVVSLSPLNPDPSLPSPEHPDYGYTFLIKVINGN